MKRTLLGLLGLITLVGGLAGCDLLDPSNTDNPDVTEDDFLTHPKAASSWLAGLERQTATTLEVLVVPAEIASDNYVNTHSFYNQFLDRLNLDYTDRDVEKGLLQVSKLREMAEFGLDVVAVHDAETIDAQRAEFWFYKGIAHLYTGEWWHTAPADSSGPAVASSEHFTLAVEAFERAVALADDAGYHVAMARAYRNLGNAEGAVREAERALALDPDYVRFARFDNVNGPSNDVQDALYNRGAYDDLQPLARLDHLDPKFFTSAEPAGGDDEASDLAYVKAEEAQLIIAEAFASSGDISGSRAALYDVLDLVAERKVVELVDVRENRTEGKPGTRPNSKDWLVAFSPDDTLRSGMVISRDEPARVAVVSGTGITRQEVDAVETDGAALALIYRARQEIFIAEGRRMHDLGIQWPVPQIEVLNNAYVQEGPATAGKVPAFLPPGSEFDAFELIDFESKQAVLKHDLNKILAQNKHEKDVLPFN